MSRDWQTVRRSGWPTPELGESVVSGNKGGEERHPELEDKQTGPTSVSGLAISLYPSIPSEGRGKFYVSLQTALA